MNNCCKNYLYGPKSHCTVTTVLYGSRMYSQFHRLRAVQYGTVITVKIALRLHEPGRDIISDVPVLYTVRCQRLEIAYFSQ